MRRRAHGSTMRAPFHIALSPRKKMSTFRRIDSLLEGKSSDQLAREVAARERERKAEPHEPHHQTPSHQPRHEAPNHPQERKPPHKKARPLLMRTSGSATEGIYGLVL